jgi:hypothetical protein
MKQTYVSPNDTVFKRDYGLNFNEWSLNSQIAEILHNYRWTLSLKNNEFLYKILWEKNFNELKNISL